MNQDKPKSDARLTLGIAVTVIAIIAFGVYGMNKTLIKHS
jgi:hypothetical protein